MANENRPPAVHATNKTSTEQDREEVHAFVVGAVPARLPVAMTVHVVDALPLTALGKVDKRRLRERVLVVQLPLP